MINRRVQLQDGDSKTSLKIDEVINQVNLMDFVFLMEKNEGRDKVIPNDGQDSDIRYKKLQEVPLNIKKQSLYQRCWKSLFLPANDAGKISRSYRINFKTMCMLNEFAFEKKQENSKFQTIQNYLSFIKVIEPKSYFYITWQITNAIIVLILSFEVLFVYFFNINLQKNHLEYLKYFIGFSIIIFIIDMIISFNTAYYVQGKLETNRFKIALHYMNSELFFDVIPIISLTFQLTNSVELFFITSPLFYLKLYELFKFQEQVYQSLRLHRRLLAMWQLTQLIIWIILICHFFGCIFYSYGNYLFEQQGHSWFDNLNGQSFYDKSIKEKYIYAFYWSVTTMVSVGYGDITPVLKEEIIVVILSMFVSCILFAYSINYIWEVIREANESRYNFERFMYYNGVSRNLRTRINAYLAHMWEADRGRDTVMEQDMINRLGPELREELIFESMGLILQQCSLFLGFTPNFVKELAQDVEEVRYSEGEKIFSAQEHEWDDMSLYYILAGSVEIYLQKSYDSEIIKLQTLRDQETFGHIGFIGGVERTASAKCLTYSRIYKLSREDFLIRLESYPDDKQHFHELRSNLIFQNKMQKLFLNCFICESDLHIATNCDKTHLVIIKDQLIYDQNKQINERKYKQRKKIEKIHTYKNLAQIQHEVKCAQRYFRDLQSDIRESDSINEDLENEQDQEQGHESEDLLDLNDSRLAIQSPKDNFEQQRENNQFNVFKKTKTVNFQSKNINFLEDNQLIRDVLMKNIDEGEVSKKKLRSFSKINLQSNLMQSEVFKKKKFGSFAKINLQNNLLQSEVFKESGQSQKVTFIHALNRKTYDINMVRSSRLPQTLKSSNNQSIIRRLKKLKNLVHNHEGHQILESLSNDLDLQEDDQAQNIKDRYETNINSIYSSDSDFSVDLMQNYENFYPEQNPEIIVKDIRKQQQKRRSQYYRR